MGELFGTDGIRGRANAHPMTVEMALRIGRAMAEDLWENAAAESKRAPRAAIGRDTRQSGPMLEGALIAGLCAAGCDCHVLGVIPTPAVAYLTRAHGLDAGLVISASHNPFYDNGIKLFGADGYKLDDTREIAIEKRILSEDTPASDRTDRVGQVMAWDDAAAQYIDFLIDTFHPVRSVADMPLVIDCANGAASRVAPLLFRRLGMPLTVLADRPDGININDGCGSENPDVLARTVRDTGARAGFAFDGDGDRLIVVDETGHVLTGDQVIAICAAHIQGQGRLQPSRVVTTVMSNLGFAEAMARLEITHDCTAVGDRHVMARMRETGTLVGGEDSGHMIFSQYHTTGDGILSSLRVLEAMIAADKPLSELARIMTVYPQVLIGVDVSRKPDLKTLPEVQAAIAEVTRELGSRGRILVRYSGTQPVCRVMVEGPTKTVTQQSCMRIADVVQQTIGN